MGALEEVINKLLSSGQLGNANPSPAQPRYGELQGAFDQLMPGVVNQPAPGVLPLVDRAGPAGVIGAESNGPPAPGGAFNVKDLLGGPQPPTTTPGIASPGAPTGGNFGGVLKDMGRPGVGAFSPPPTQTSPVPPPQHTGAQQTISGMLRPTGSTPKPTKPAPLVHPAPGRAMAKRSMY